MPTEAKMNPSEVQTPEVRRAQNQQRAPQPAGPRAPANKMAKVTSVARPGARYQFLTHVGEFKKETVATYEQIHGHAGLGCNDDHNRHTGCDVADLIQRGIIEQVADDTPLTDEGRPPAINPDAVETQQKMWKASQAAAGK